MARVDTQGTTTRLMTIHHMHSYPHMDLHHGSSSRRSFVSIRKGESGDEGSSARAPSPRTPRSRYMNYDPKEPQWINRDRFVLSNGHA